MTDLWLITIGEFIATYWIHSSLFLGTALLAIKMDQVRADNTGERLLKLALIAGVLTSVLTVFGGTSESRRNQFFSLNLSLSSTSQVTLADKIDSANEHKSQPETDHAYIVGVQPTSQQPLNLSVSTNVDPVEESDTSAMTSVKDEPFYGKNIVFWLALIWVLSVLSVGVKKVRQVISLKKTLSNRTPVSDLSLLKTLDFLVQRSGFQGRVILTESESAISPLVLSKNEIVLPVGFRNQLPQSQIQAALAHELAHIKRKDMFWLKLGIVMEVIFVIQPLNRLINLEIHQLAEQQTDLLATEWTGDPKALVEALSTVASFRFRTDTLHNRFIHSKQSSDAAPINQSSQTGMVLAMKSNKSNLIIRVENLLKNSRSRTQRTWIVVAVLLSTLVIVAAPGVSIRNANANQSHSHTSSEIEIDDDGVSSYTMTSIHNGKRMKIKAEIVGEIGFNDDESELIKFPKHSYLDITDDNGSVERRIKIERESGELNYTYYVDDDKKPYDARAKQWFVEVIPKFLRMSGIDAKNRVIRIRKKLGDEGVIEEVKKIKSDHVSGSYLRYLLVESELSDGNLTKVIKLTEDIGSDFEQAKVLIEIVKRQNLSREFHWNAILEATRKISSDFEQAKVLKSFIGLLPEDEAVQLKLISVATGISSDFEMRRVFSAYLLSEKTSDAILVSLMKAAKEIGSDFELSALLMEVAEKSRGSKEIFDVYLTLATSISSDFELRRALSYLLKLNVDDEQLNQVITLAAKNISSDFELASLLVEVIEQSTLDPELIEVLKKSTESISSRFERSRVLEKLVDKIS